MQNTQTESLSKPSILQFIKNSFTQTPKKCIKDNQARYICVDKKCVIKNSFICSNEECKCFSQHQECQQATLKSFQKKISNFKSEYFELENRINIQTDSVIDYISQRREKIVSLIRQGKASEFFKSNKKEKQPEIQKELVLSEINQLVGAKNYLIQNSIIQNKVNQKAQSFIRELQKQSGTLKNRKIKQYFDLIQHRLQLLNSPKVWISRNLSSKKNVIDKFTIKSTTSDSHVDFTLLQPSINRISGNIIRWKVKIIKLSNWIRLGVGLRQFLKQKKFSIAGGWNNQQQTGHYCLSSNSYTWAYKSKQQNNVNKGFSFTTGDTITIQVNKSQHTIKFQRNGQTIQMKITHQVDIDKDEYHLCVGLWQPNDSVQILSTIQLDGIKHELQQTPRADQSKE